MTAYTPGAAETLAAILPCDREKEPVPPQSEETRSVALAMGGLMAQCAMAAITKDRETVITSSAGFVCELLALWEDQGIDAEAVWIELHGRIEVGELCHQMSRAPGRLKGRRKAAWRVATSKLP